MTEIGKNKLDNKSGLNTSDRAGSLRGSMKGDAGTSGRDAGGPNDRDQASYFAFLGHTSMAYKFKGSG